MDKSEGIQPESMKPGKPSENSVPSDMPEAGTPPPEPRNVQSDGDDDDGQFFTPGNLVMMAMLLGLAALVASKFNMIEIWAICKAALGLSFVIFIHELGHFLAAKWCDVKVDTFSIGFGPAIPGCRFRWGETTYKLAIFPLGGYVQMLGQVDGDESSDGSEDDPRSYRTKAIWQRMLIISAGVVMNAILAVICFIGVYMGPGKEQMAGVIGNVDTHGPGFEKGLRPGATIERIGRSENPTFPNLMQTVISTSKNEAIPIIFKRPDDAKPVETTIKPRKDADDLRPMIGIVSPSRLKFVSARETREGHSYAGTPSAKAAFALGDVIVGMTDPDHPDQKKGYNPELVSPLRDDPRYPDHDQKDYFQFYNRLQLLADKDIVVQVRRGTEVVNVKEIKPLFRISYGARMQMGPILAVREQSEAADPEKGVRKPDADKNLEGDRIEAVTVTDENGATIEYTGDTLDPERLPLQLRRWSDAMHRAGKGDDLKVTLQVRRHREQPGMQFESKKIELRWDHDWRFDRISAVHPDAPMPIPELGLAYQIKTTVQAVTGANNPLQPGDVIKSLRYEIEGFKEVNKSDELKPGQWASISDRVFNRPYKFNKVTFKVLRGKEEKDLDITFSEDTASPIVERGWLLLSDTRRVKADDPWHAVVMGSTDTYNKVVEVFQNLKGVLTNRLSVKNFGGPLTIASAAYRFAAMDYSDLIFFLGLISINLAVVNFLPIPVLDGGHMVFLIYEKLRGKPASEGIRTVATIAGLVMILALMIFVTYLDVMREFFS